MNPQSTPPIDTTLIIAILGLLISLITLFVSYLNPGRVKCNFGPTITLFYKHRELLPNITESKRGTKGNRQRSHALYIYVPTTFINSGSRTGSIFRIALSVHKKGKPEQTHYMDWRAFCSYHRESGIWAEDELAHQVSVQGNSTISKWVSFYWGAHPTIEFTEGSYIVDIYYWSKLSLLPYKEQHELLITKLNLLDIKKNITENRDMVEVSLDEKNRPISLTNQQNIGSLIDDKSKGFTQKTNYFALASTALGFITLFIISIEDKMIAHPFRVSLWQNPRVITVLLTALPIMLGCLVVTIYSLKRLWDSRKIIKNLKKGRSYIIVQTAAPAFSLLLMIACVFYITTKFF